MDPEETKVEGEEVVVATPEETTEETTEEVTPVTEEEVVA